MATPKRSISVGIFSLIKVRILNYCEDKNANISFILQRNIKEMTIGDISDKGLTSRNTNHVKTPCELKKKKKKKSGSQSLTEFRNIWRQVFFIALLFRNYWAFANTLNLGKWHAGPFKMRSNIGILSFKLNVHCERRIACCKKTLRHFILSYCVILF